MSGWQKKRFWSKLSISAVQNGFLILLDDKPLKTPAKALLKLPTRALARLIADEWEGQGEVLEVNKMEHTRRANSAIDKVGAAREAMIAGIVGYGQSDLLCYRESAESALIAAQNEGWEPVLEWAEKTLDLRFTLQRGLMPVAQSAETVEKCTQLVKTYSDFQLVALSELVALSGSFLLGVAAVRKTWKLDEIWKKSRIDEDFQAQRWGRDAHAHAVALQKYDSFCLAFAFYCAATQDKGEEK